MVRRCVMWFYGLGPFGKWKSSVKCVKGSCTKENNASQARRLFCNDTYHLVHVKRVEIYDRSRCEKKIYFYIT